jgi:hypothetical protein
MSHDRIPTSFSLLYFCDGDVYPGVWKARFIERHLKSTDGEVLKFRTSKIAGWEVIPLHLCCQQHNEQLFHVLLKRMRLNSNQIDDNTGLPEFGLSSGNLC